MWQSLLYWDFQFSAGLERRRNWNNHCLPETPLSIFLTGMWASRSVLKMLTNVFCFVRIAPEDNLCACLSSSLPCTTRASLSVPALGPVGGLRKAYKSSSFPFPSVCPVLSSIAELSSSTKWYINEVAWDSASILVLQRCPLPSQTTPSLLICGIKHQQDCLCLSGVWWFLSLSLTSDHRDWLKRCSHTFESKWRPAEVY